MRAVLAVIWAVIVFGVTAVVINLCATLGFPPGSSSVTSGLPQILPLSVKFSK